MLIEAALGGTALFLFGRGLYHSGVLAGWIGQGLLQQPTPAPTAAPAPSHNPEEHEMRLFLDTRAWWLDPNRWGDDPDWRSRIPGPVTSVVTNRCKHCGEGNYIEKYNTLLCDKCGDYRSVNPPYLDADPPIEALEPTYRLRPCPSCGRAGHAHIKVLANHGDEATLMECERCGCEYTPAGPTKAWTKEQKLMRGVAIQRKQLPSHPDVLPCGCPGNGSITRSKSGGTTWTGCGKCSKWWEPRSDDATGRWIAQGEYVQDRDTMDPGCLAAWGRRVNQPDRNHGACPTLTCQWPVDKRDGMYYCSNTGCHRHYGGWR